MSAHDDPAGKLLAPAEDKGDESDPESDSEKQASRSKPTPLTPSVRVPGKTAIAGVLIAKWANRELDGLGYNFAQAAPRPKI